MIFSFYGFSAKVVAREYNSAAEIAKRCLQVVKFICKNKSKKRLNFRFVVFLRRLWQETQPSSRNSKTMSACGAA